MAWELHCMLYYTFQLKKTTSKDEDKSQKLHCTAWYGPGYQVFVGKIPIELWSS